MATLSAPATQVSARPERSAGMKLERIPVPVGVTVAALGMAVLLVLPPVVMHPLLDAAGSARFMGITPAEAHRLSDLTVAELVFGPGTFAVAGPDGGPLYDGSEIGHLKDARVLLYGFLAIASLGALGVIASVARVRDEGRRQAWSRVSRSGLGLAVGIAILGVVALLAFEPAFE
ncbi:MAG TPA: hypothetical protein VGP30_02950, partial [Candidatus Limnocylindrales bacterium]|nr:hypothetical protein [Candidatus Limnocylindrales bacterium]